MANSVPLALQRSLPQNDEELFLDDQTQWNARLWRRLARATEAVAGIPVAWPLPWECRAAQSRQLRPEKVQEPSWGAANKGVIATLLPMLSGRDMRMLSIRPPVLSPKTVPGRGNSQSR